MSRHLPRLSHDRRVLLLALAGGAPAVITATVLVWFSGYPPRVQWLLSVLIVAAWLGFCAAAHARVVRSLQTVSNLLTALREGDFSIRGRGCEGPDPLGDVIVEINSLGDTLQKQRLGAVEATALLRTVIEEIDVGVFAFDGDVLRLVNRAGARLLDEPGPILIGRTARDLGIGELLAGEPARIIEAIRFPGADAKNRWSLRRSTFREGGLPHTLVVVSDVSQALREEEIKAWQRLVRVLGHELNNSLAPIKSIAGSLGAIMKSQSRASDWEQDMHSGLEIIDARAEGLTRFLEAYARLTRLPAPNMAPVEIRALVQRVAGLEIRLPVQVEDGPDLTVNLDAAQIEQVLINLIMNAVDATSSTEVPGGVRVRWIRSRRTLEIEIEDDGPGIANPSNLFVPFFTTKEKGSGIGLVLCRQIVENHGGTISLENREDGRSGCVARLRLPL